MIDIDSVIRIHTDSIAFTKEQQFDEKLFKLEDKSTGLILWKNVNTYHHKCLKCNLSMKYDTLTAHEC